MPGYKTPNSTVNPNLCTSGKGKRYRFDYEKPIIIKQTTMTFPIDIIEATGRGVVCKQCSACHTCR